MIVPIAVNAELKRRHTRINLTAGATPIHIEMDIEAQIKPRGKTAQTAKLPICACTDDDTLAQRLNHLHETAERFVVEKWDHVFVVYLKARASVIFHKECDNLAQAGNMK